MTERKESRKKVLQPCFYLGHAMYVPHLLKPGHWVSYGGKMKTLQELIVLKAKVSYDKTTPKCFDNAKQFTCWVAAARMAQPTPTHSYCEDCTPDFQAKMIREMRCQYPGTLFHKAEGGWVGRRSFVEVSKIRRRAEIGDPDLI